jgi:hypothetical protein
MSAPWRTASRVRAPLGAMRLALQSLHGCIRSTPRQAAARLQGGHRHKAYAHTTNRKIG